MAVEVRIPTILRSYTAGEKAVAGRGDTVAALFADIEERYPGIRARLVTAEGALHRFVNVYINDEDVRFLGALDAKVNDGDTVTILPAVAGGAPAMPVVARTGAGTAMPVVARTGAGTAMPVVARTGAATGAPGRSLRPVRR